MVTTFENLPNEIFIDICSNLSWIQLLTCFWSLNKRFNSLIYSILSIDNNKKFNSGLTMIDSGFSFNQCSSILFPLKSYPLSLITLSIRRIHFDETNSNICSLIDQWHYDLTRKRFCFPNLKTLILTRCLLIKPLMKILPFLIQYQLEELKLTFDEDAKDLIEQLESSESSKNEVLNILQQFMCQLFSAQSQLSSLHIDITYMDYELYEYLQSSSNKLSSYQSPCVTLRSLHIRLEDSYFLEYLIEYVPSLEKLSVYFEDLLNTYRRSESQIQNLIQTDGNWFNKVRKLEYFAINTMIMNDLEFFYLKWLLNNFKHIQKLKVHLEINYTFSPDNKLNHLIIDANFICQYCLPDTINNLIDFNFDISTDYKLKLGDIEKVIYSFQIHPIFLEHQWTNVKCFSDPRFSYQHISSSNISIPSFFDCLVYNRNIYQSNVRCICIHLDPSLHIFLQQLNQLFPHVFCIRIYLKKVYQTNDRLALKLLDAFFAIENAKSNKSRLENVTRLSFGHNISRIQENTNEPIDDRKIRANLMAYLISMPMQLIDLRVDKFQWLLDVVQYASDRLRKNALNTVRYAEINSPSCNFGQNETIRIGQNLVAFLSTYMPNLETLHLWRPDDFLWTSLRSDFKKGYWYSKKIIEWRRILQTSESIHEHAKIFEKDLCQLFEQMKRLVFLDIHGEISDEKVEAYRSMVQKCFPNSRSTVKTLRFRLWI